MPYPVSSQFIKTLASSDQTRVISAQIWNGETPLADLGTVTDGSVGVDVTSQIRRTCSLTINSQGLEFDNLVPTSVSSLLHPASGNELRLFRGFDYTPGSSIPWQKRQATPGDLSVELCPLGVFRMTKPNVVDTGDAITITVTGNDRSALVSARKWLDVYPIVGGTDVRQAVHDMIQSRVPELNLVYKLAPTYGITVPAVSYGTDLSGSNDPFADASSVALVAAMELFFDETGALVMQLIPSPSTIAPSFVNPSIYAEGQNCTIVEAERALDETQTYNGVIVIGIGSGGAPIQAEVWDNDPSSPTWVGGPWGYQPYIYQTSLIPSSPQTSGAIAQAQALSLAQTLFQQVRTLLDTPEFQCIPNPSLLESDVITLVRQRIGLNADYTLAQMTIPLDAAGSATTTSTLPGDMSSSGVVTAANPMIVTCRPLNLPVFGTPPAPPPISGGGSTGEGPIFSRFSPPGGEVGEAYDYTFEASDTPTYGIFSGAVPVGLTFDDSTGELSGTPTTANTYEFVVSASTDGGTTYVSCAITVIASGTPPTWVRDTPPGATLGAAYTYDFEADDVVTYAKASGSFPAGLSLDATTGALTGTPTTADTYTFVMSATNAFGTVDTGTLSITVGTSTGRTPDPGTADLPFTDNGTSIWYTPIPGSPSIDPDSATFVSNLITAATDDFDDISFNSSGGYSTCKYILDSVDDSDVEMITVAINPATWAGSPYPYHNGSRPTGSVTVPAKTWMVAPGVPGEDDEVSIYDTALSQAHEFWQMEFTVGYGWVCETYAFYSTTTGANSTGVSTRGTPTPVSTTVTATGMSNAAGLIKALDVQSGIPTHCLMMAIPVTSSPPRAPANYSDGGGASGSTIPEGTRFFFPADVDMPSGLNAFGQYVFLAIQQFGFYITDTAGSVVLWAENSAAWIAAGLPDPWADFPYTSINLDVLPWTELKALVEA